MQGFDYAVYSDDYYADDYAAGVERTERLFERVRDFWNSKHPREPFWPVFSWPRRFSKWKKDRNLFIRLAMDIDLRITFSKQMTNYHVSVSASTLYGQVIEDPLPKLYRLLDSVPYEDNGMSREKIILLLILGDDGSSWGLPAELLIQLIEIPAESYAPALEDLRRSAASFDEKKAQKRSKN